MFVHHKLEGTILETFTLLFFPGTLKNFTGFSYKQQFLQDIQIPFIFQGFSRI